MKITPLDIQHKTFRTALRGYHEEDVDKYLDEVAGELEHFFTENSELKERLEKSKDKLAEYKKMEQTLHNTLLTAQRLADEVRGNAEQEAAATMQDAGAKSREILDAAVRQREELLQSIDRLRKAEEQFRTKLRSVLDTYYEFIDRGDQVVRPEFLEAEEQLGRKVASLLPGAELSSPGGVGDIAEMSSSDARPLPGVMETGDYPGQPAVTVPAGMEISGRPAIGSFPAQSEMSEDSPTRETYVPVQEDAFPVSSQQRIESDVSVGSTWGQSPEAEQASRATFDNLTSPPGDDPYIGRRGPEEGNSLGSSGDSERGDRPFVGFYDQEDGPAKVDFSDLGEGVPGALRRARQGRQEEERPLAVTETD